MCVIKATKRSNSIIENVCSILSIKIIYMLTYNNNNYDDNNVFSRIRKFKLILSTASLLL